VHVVDDVEEEVRDLVRAVAAVGEQPARLMLAKSV